MTQKSANRGLIVVWFLLAILTGLVATVIARTRPVEVVVDLEQPATEGVRAQWDGGEVAFEAVADAYAPTHYTVNVVSEATEAQGSSGGYQMIAMAAIDESRLSPEEAWLSVSTYFLLHGDQRPATVALSGWNIGPSPYLSFETDVLSGDVRIEQPGVLAVTRQLRSEQRGKEVYPLQADGRRYRYYGSVPRAKVDEVTLVATGLGGTAVERLYVNSWIPQVFYRDTAPVKRRPPGRITEQWAATWSGDTLLLPGVHCFGANFLLSSVVGTLFAALILGVLYAVFRLAVGQLRTGANTSPESWLPEKRPWKRGLLLWGCTGFVWLVVLVAFYPGTMNADSISQWEQAMTYQFEPQHPPFYAWIMWLTRHLWDSPSTTILLQVMVGSGLVAWAANLLWAAGVHRAVVLAVYLLGTFSPRNITTMIALIKDAPYGVCLFAAALCLTTILLRPDKKNWGYWAGLGLALGAATLFRHNGPLLMVAFLPCLAVVCYRHWRGVALCVAVTAVVFLGARAAVLSRLPIEAGEGGLHDMMTAHLAILVDRDVPITNEEYAFLAKVRDLEDRWAYDERRVAATTMPFLEEAYHRAWAKENTAAYRGAYLGLVLDNPLTAARYFWDRGSFLVVPWSTDIPMETYFIGISKNDLGLSNFQFFLNLPDQLRALLAWTAGDGVRWLFWRPALSLYLITLAGIVLCFRLGDFRWGIIYLPFLLNTAIIGVAAISQASRYQFPLTFAAAFLLGLACLPKVPNAKKEASPE